MTMSILNDEFIQKAHEDAIFKDGIAVGEERGISIGEERMRVNLTNTISQRMLESGYPCEEVARLSGLSIEEVNALKASMV